MMAADAERANARVARGLAIAIGVLAIVIRFWVSYRTHALGEDALITLRYAENIAAGRGCVYNPGERVLGTTTPLFTLILAAFAWLRLPAMQCGIAINILADGATCYLIARLMARPEICRPIAGLFAALLYAVSSTPSSVTISGMETALVTCAGMAAVHAYTADRPRALGLCGAALFLLRIDGMLLFAALFVGLWLRSRRVPLIALAVFAASIAPWIAFAALYFGSPVPESVIAKLAVYNHTAWTPGSFTDTAAFNREAFRNQFTLGWPQRITTLLFVAGFLMIALDAIGRMRSAGPSSRQLLPSGPTADRGLSVLLPALLWLVVYYGTMLTSHVPAFPWYFLPPWPMFLIVATLSLEALVRRAAHGVDLSRAWPAALALFAVIGLVHVRSVERDIAVMQVREDTLRRPLGIWLRDNLAPGDRVLLEPIGYAGYYSGRRILDMVGLVSPEVLPYYRTPDALGGIVRNLRPEWLCLRRSEVDRLHADHPQLTDPA